MEKLTSYFEKMFQAKWDQESLGNELEYTKHVADREHIFMNMINKPPWFNFGQANEAELGLSSFVRWIIKRYVKIFKLEKKFEKISKRKKEEIALRFSHYLNTRVKNLTMYKKIKSDGTKRVEEKKPEMAESTV